MTTSALASVGWNEHWRKAFEMVAGAEDIPARVVRHDGVALLVQTPDEVLQVRMHLKDTPTVGDWVVITGGVAGGILERTSTLRRLDPDGTSQQLLAANVDLVMIVLALDRPISNARLGQALRLVLDSGAQPLVVLSKSDAHDDAEAVAQKLRDQFDVDIVAISVKTDDGVDDLLARAADRTVVLLGESGAGKSTITNGLIGSEVAATKEVSERNALGRHTTTTRELRSLPGGGVLIDSPGIRSFASFTEEDETGAPDIQFSDLEEIAEGCRFNNCGHSNEPGCAITAALAAKEIDAKRVRLWKSSTQASEQKAESALAASRAEKKQGRPRRR